MHITFSPQRRDDALVLERTAPDRLRINGELFNFAPLQEGDTIPDVPCEWIIGPVIREDGVVHLTLIWPHGPNEPDAPQPITVTEDGPINVDA